MIADSNLIFVIEDDRAVARVICENLRDFGFRTEHFLSGQSLMNRLKTTVPSLCIVDLGLPDRNGLDLVREIQSAGPTAIIILTGRGHPSDRVVGLEHGADDYVVKPFEPRELVARVRSVLRRVAPGAQSAPTPAVACFEGWRFDLGSQQLFAADGRQVALSAAEARLLKTLVRSPNRILSRESLLENRADLAPFDRSIDVRISRLRRKFGEDPQEPRLIKTVYGAGYMLCATVLWEIGDRRPHD